MTTTKREILKTFWLDTLACTRSMTRAEVADITGIPRVKVGTALAKMAKEGWVRFNANSWSPHSSSGVWELTQHGELLLERMLRGIEDG